MSNFIIETLPLIAFFIGYKMGGILKATLVMITVMPLCILFDYFKKGKINKVTLFSFFLTLVLYLATLYSGSTTFIKVKPTLFYCLMATILLITQIYKKPAIRYVFEKVVKMDIKGWNKLNLRFIYFFIFMAVINELIWRNFSEDVWVNFKVFGALPITLIFIITQMRFIFKNRLNEN